MREIVIISGKGGTGKTTVTAAFASLAKNKVMADCDVDAADLHLILAPEIKHREDFRSGKSALIREADCTQCGKCIELCRFDAIDDNFVVDPVSCEGCGVCVWFCPAEAIDFKENTSGQWFISDTRFGPLVHAKLGIAEENSGKLVTLVRRQAKQVAESESLDTIIIDGAPGVGCPVISSITGSSAVLIVSEPTLSGLHDMKRVAELATGHFNIQTFVCVNKYDLNQEITNQIKAHCDANQLTFVGQIPYDESVTRAMVQGKNVIEYGNEIVKRAIESIWDNLLNNLP
ncbi:ATP-binding protein [candidate division KSB1 bacterium]|nr:ATP-binding protein [candidate division KSB1 bacterium]